jgi:hypothetical protein
LGRKVSDAQTSVKNEDYIIKNNAKNEYEDSNGENQEDETTLDEDVALAVKIRVDRAKTHNLPPQVDLPKLLANGVFKTVTGFEKFKNYITADDIYQRQIANDQRFVQNPPRPRNLSRESVV